jgi:hypothetical protein
MQKWNAIHFFTNTHTQLVPTQYVWLAAQNGPTNVENYLPGNVVGPITTAGPTCLVLYLFRIPTGQ